jgi:hypothetical protein
MEHQITPERTITAYSEPHEFPPHVTTFSVTKSFIVVTLGQILFVQGDQKVSAHLMITVQKIRKNIFKQFQSLTMVT